MKMVVGLGNPGLQYRKTRHNIGWDVVAELARRHGGSSPKIKHDAELVDVFLGSEKLLLVAPQTFMNASGRSVQPLVDFYQLSLGDVLVVCDDMNLDLGRLRLRGSGSAGGQKGLADIINRLGTDEIARLRVGIGRPPGKMDPADYVLSKFRGDEVQEATHAVVAAADGVELWSREGLATAMNQINAPSDR